MVPMDTIVFLVIAVVFVLFILPRLSSMMGGGAGYPNNNYPQGNYPNNNRPTYDSDDVESRGSIGRDRNSNSGGIFGNILSRPSGRSGSTGGTGIFRTPSSSRGNVSSSSSRRNSPDIESRGGIGRDRD
jgi:hypothetical protein